LLWQAWSWMFRGRRRYKLAMAVVKMGIRIAPFLPWHPDKLGAWTRGRELPEIPPQGSFRRWWRTTGANLKPADRNTP
ncbi:MAG: DUF3390 domain-containing protein, partial [Pirellulales bacterium]|nr:DUF3390 domain-containing protein [Pirellulales bacterium]